jgi:hypothetical protein
MNTQKSLSRFIIPMEAKSEKFHIPFFHNHPWQFGVLISWFLGFGPDESQNDNI